MRNNNLKKKYRYAEKLCMIYNLLPNLKSFRLFVLKKLLYLKSNRVCIKPPFFCSIGKNISIGSDFFCNRNCIFLDDARITIGNHVMIGPNVGLYTVNHPLQAHKRRNGEMICKEIVIQDDVWIAANCIILPGVTIGRGSVIAAGVVVDKNIPEYSLVKRNYSTTFSEIR